MEPLQDIDAERSRVLQEIRRLTSDVADIVAQEVEALDDGIRTLASLREEAYELTNQLQHTAMIFQATSELATGDFAGEEARWQWNARQTDSIEEPDPQREVNGDIVISAEVTTSQKPDGGIDPRMARSRRKRSQCVPSVKAQPRALSRSTGKLRPVDVHQGRGQQVLSRRKEVPWRSI